MSWRLRRFDRRFARARRRQQERLIRRLPLTVEKATARGRALRLSGRGWSLSTNTPWRVTRGADVLFGWSSPELWGEVEPLRGAKLIHVQFGDEGLDPTAMPSWAGPEMEWGSWVTRADFDNGLSVEYFHDGRFKEELIV